MNRALYRVPKADTETIESFIRASYNAKRNRVDSFYESCMLRGMLLGFYGLRDNNRIGYVRALKDYLPADHRALSYLLPKNAPNEYTIENCALSWFYNNFEKCNFIEVNETAFYRQEFGL